MTEGSASGQFRSWPGAPGSRPFFRSLDANLG